MAKAIARRHSSPFLHERRYTVREAACLADVGERTLKAALRSGELAGSKWRKTFTARPSGERYRREWWVVSGAALVDWYERRRTEWTTNGKRGPNGYSGREDRARKQRRERAWRQRQRALVALAREIVRQAGDELVIELEGDDGQAQGLER